MGFIYRKRIKLLPGVRLNLSRHGISTSIGTRGATVNISGDRTRASVGIAGSGISYRTQSTIKPGESAPARQFSISRVLLLIAMLGVLLYLL
ncbi:MAG: DUF4236 domain-containing protein [Gallionella sp.]